MNDKKNARGTHMEFPLEDDMSLTGTVSAADCTGIVQSGSVNSAEEFGVTNALHRYSAAHGRKHR